MEVCGTTGRSLVCACPQLRARPWRVLLLKGPMTGTLTRVMTRKPPKVRARWRLSGLRVLRDAECSLVLTWRLPRASVRTPSRSRGCLCGTRVPACLPPAGPVCCPAGEASAAGVCRTAGHPQTHLKVLFRSRRPEAIALLRPMLPSGSSEAQPVTRASQDEVTAPWCGCLPVAFARGAGLSLCSSCEVRARMRRHRNGVTCPRAQGGRQPCWGFSFYLPVGSWSLW